MSGSALTPWAIARDAELYARNIAQDLNCPIHVSLAILAIVLLVTILTNSWTL